MNKVVIGANFGDEGKGLMIDYFVSQFHGKCMVVRFNGGAQAGHTVVTPEGKRHVFSHFGAGSFLGAPTYLSKFFIVNPMIFMKELEEGQGSFGLPKVYVDKECLVSTPYDMHINQLREKLRGDKRHGSCGIGINETVDRSQEEYYRLETGNLPFPYDWKNRFLRIAKEWYPKKLEELGEPNPGFDHDKFIEIFEQFIYRTRICDYDIMKNENLVFEGAQGLLLDQNHEFFPHVTRSNTGFQNVKEILRDIDDSDETEVVYVSRSYMTRHGRGPFPTEINGLPYDRVKDDTNVDHEFQEHLRYGLIDTSELIIRINDDVFKNLVQCTSIAITCMDQIDNSGMEIYHGPNLYRVKSSDFLEMLESEIPIHQTYLSFGPTRSTVCRRERVV